jgi:hypothetical protein
MIFSSQLGRMKLRWQAHKRGSFGWFAFENNGRDQKPQFLTPDTVGGSCVRVLKTHVFNTALGNLEGKIEQYSRPTFDVRCLQLYMLGGAMVWGFFEKPGYFFVSYSPPILYTWVSTGGIDSMPIRAPSCTEVCCDTTRRKKNHLKICSLSDLHSECCHNLVNRVICTYCGI